MHIPNLFQKSCEEFKLDFKNLDETTSTNDEAKMEALSTNSEFRIYFTGQQTAGRGRKKNSWESPTKNSSLMATFSFALKTPPQPIATPLFGLALYRAVKSAFDEEGFYLKAPNDLYLNKKKCGGLLLESVQMGERIRLVIGLGINVLEPAQNTLSSCLKEANSFSDRQLDVFFKCLIKEFSKASISCQGSHLSEIERKDLLIALNMNTQLDEKYTALSPFGDLSTANIHISWKDL